LYSALISASTNDDFAYPAQCDQETRLNEYENLLYLIKWMAIGAKFERWHRQFGGLAIITVRDGIPPFPSLVTHASGGALTVTDSIVSPALGNVCQGTWVKIGPHKYTFTFLCFMYDEKEELDHTNPFLVNALIIYSFGISTKRLW
jgi:hypothetical protein